MKTVTIAPTQRANDRLGVALALFSLYIIWGATYLAIRVGVATIPPFLLAGTRFSLAGGALFLFLRRRGAPAPSRRQWAGAALVGSCLLVTGNGLVSFAEQWVASGLTAVGLATVPLWAALFAGLWGQWPRRSEWGGLVLGFAGVILLNLESDFRANLLGAAALAVAAISWAFGTVVSRRVPLPAGPMSSAAEMLAASVLLFAISIARGEQAPARLDGSALLAVGYLIIFGSLIAFSAYGYLLPRVSPALATSYAYVNPVVAVALGVGLAGEHITPLGLVAMLAILGGVVLVTLGRARPQISIESPID